MLRTRTHASLTLCLMILGAAGVALASHAPPAADAPVTNATTHPELGPGVSVKHVLTLEGANRVIAAAIARAKERGAGGAIAVVDDGGNLIALQRLDGTFAAGAIVSIGKARTAALFKKPTKVFEDSINGGRFALGSVHEMTPLQGGVPIIHEGYVIGGVGVSGAHSQAEDEEVALAGAGALVSDPTPTSR